MHCYTVDFGQARMAVCEEDFGHDLKIIAQEEITSDPTPETWAKLGAILQKSGEILEAQ